MEDKAPSEDTKILKETQKQKLEDSSVNTESNTNDELNDGETTKQ